MHFGWLNYQLDLLSATLRVVENTRIRLLINASVKILAITPPILLSKVYKFAGEESKLDYVLHSHLWQNIVY